jgi:hypothetical protein
MQELKEIKEAISGIKEAVHSIDKTLVRQEATLQDHVRRSLANEQAVELLRQEIAPVKTHVQLMNTMAKVFVAVGGLVIGILKLMGGI